VPTCAGECRFVRVIRVLIMPAARACVAAVLANAPGKHPAPGRASPQPALGWAEFTMARTTLLRPTGAALNTAAVRPHGMSEFAAPATARPCPRQRRMFVPSTLGTLSAH